MRPEERRRITLEILNRLHEGRFEDRHPLCDCGAGKAKKHHARECLFIDFVYLREEMVRDQSD